MTNACLDCGKPCKSCAKRCIPCGNRRSMYGRKEYEEVKGTPLVCSECGGDFVAKNPKTECCSDRCAATKKLKIANQKWLAKKAVKPKTKV